MRETLDEQIVAVLPGGVRHGKTLAQAQLVARMLKEGHTVTVATADGRVERVVGVPGFDDGRQIEDKTDA